MGGCGLLLSLLLFVWSGDRRVTQRGVAVRVGGGLHEVSLRAPGESTQGLHCRGVLPRYPYVPLQGFSGGVPGTGWSYGVYPWVWAD